MTIFWFRRDLRIDDNKGFFEALKNGQPVLPLFIFDKNILDELPKDDARVTFIHTLLTKINSGLNAAGKSLAVFYGTPDAVFEQLAIENKIENVYTNHDYEPYARQRDLAVFQVFKKYGINFKTYKDQVIFEKDEVIKDDGKPYVVYTPYANKWKQNFKSVTLENYNSEDLIDKITGHTYPFLSLKDISFEPSEIKVTPFDSSEILIRNYEQTRNFPFINKTSYLGAHLRFGAISIRKIVAKASKEQNETFLKELIWREFFMQILWHFPHTKSSGFKSKYDAVQWNNNEDDFKKWCEGKTGYPFVDAGMRELNQTGHMHNRVRMIVAGFLCKHLLIDWRWGEAYFALKLLDYEQ
ncbi:MAG TPA: deoxyribodipyrimidine photo-lyase, partial [Flavobacterium sp.]